MQQRPLKQRTASGPVDCAPPPARAAAAAAPSSAPRPPTSSRLAESASRGGVDGRGEERRGDEEERRSVKEVAAVEAQDWRSGFTSRVSCDHKNIRQRLEFAFDGGQTAIGSVPMDFLFSGCGWLARCLLRHRKKLGQAKRPKNLQPHHCCRKSQKGNPHLQIRMTAILLHSLVSQTGKQERSWATTCFVYCSQAHRFAMKAEFCVLHFCYFQRTPAVSIVPVAEP